MTRRRPGINTPDVTDNTLTDQVTPGKCRCGVPHCGRAVLGAIATDREAVRRRVHELLACQMLVIAVRRLVLTELEKLYDTARRGRRLDVVATELRRLAGRLDGEPDRKAAA
ncbi:MAG: hypothetical protein ACRD0U_15530 [Acidimicrobiales bacterium]